MIAKRNETVLNSKLAELIARRHPTWSDENVLPECTGVVRNHPSWQPDIFLHTPDGQPIVIEAKFSSERKGLHQQLAQRLGCTSEFDGEMIECGVAVTYPDELKPSNLDSATLGYAVYDLDQEFNLRRYPNNRNHWLKCHVNELVDLIEIVSLSERRIRIGEQILETGVHDISNKLRQRTLNYPEMSTGIATALQQEDCEQTTRMAVAILINAFVFHYALEGTEGIPKVDQHLSSLGRLDRTMVLQAWDTILRINYFPIFRIAREILANIPTPTATGLLHDIDHTAKSLVDIGALTFQDLAGRMFQTLITDRKFIATFYTLPESASLLAELAIDRLNTKWSDLQSVTNLKIADFACGTGQLLSAVQRGIYRKVRRTGQSTRSIHRTVVERILTGIDIMPSAAHLTATMLSSTYPQVTYHKSLVHAVPYGRFVRETESKRSSFTSIGSLDFLREEYGKALCESLEFKT